MKYALYIIKESPEVIGFVDSLHSENSVNVNALWTVTGNSIRL